MPCALSQSQCDSGPISSPSFRQQENLRSVHIGPEHSTSLQTSFRIEGVSDACCSAISVVVQSAACVLHHTLSSLSSLQPPAGLLHIYNLKVIVTGGLMSLVISALQLIFGNCVINSKFVETLSKIIFLLF